MARSRLTSGKRAKLGWGRSLRALPPGPLAHPPTAARALNIVTRVAVAVRESAARRRARSTSAGGPRPQF